MRKLPLTLLGFLLCAVAFAQQGTNYKLTEYTFNVIRLDRRL